MNYKDLLLGDIPTAVGSVNVVSTKWSIHDRIGALKVRWSIGRMKYRITPGIYAAGSPDQDSPVFVSASFKLSFDHLRRALDGLSAWILVLDTKGINVWCAAGKGTFSTKELVRRIRIHHLDQLVNHRKLMVPQLGATGVAAYKVKKMTGFSVLYGPVRARDIQPFIRAGHKATKEMRTITFPLAERLKLIPVDVFYGRYYLIVVPLLFFAASGIDFHGFSVDNMLHSGWKAVVNLYSGYLAGVALTPVLLPWIPFRMFSWKGLVTGWLIACILALSGMFGKGLFGILSWFLMLGGLSSFLAMNFTGSSTYTSLSGVQKEMKRAIPIQIGMAGLGVAGWIIIKFINL